MIHQLHVVPFETQKRLLHMVNDTSSYRKFYATLPATTLITQKARIKAGDPILIKELNAKIVSFSINFNGPSGIEAWVLSRDTQLSNLHIWTRYYLILLVTILLTNGEADGTDWECGRLYLKKNYTYHFYSFCFR